MSKKRRGSRLFSGQPGLLLVSEDIPGIIMPAPPSVADLPPLEEEEDAFDIDALHAAEDAEESAGHGGPLRVFLGTPGTEPDTDETPAAAAPAAADAGPIWDVSALAMPEAPDEAEASESLDFLDESHDVEDDDVVSLDTTPPPLVMQVSLDEDAGLSEGDWADESPTIPAMPMPSLAPTPPAVHVTPQGDPLDVPDRSPFEGDAAGFTEDAPTRVENMVNAALGDADLNESEWNEDEETFFGDREVPERSVPDTPPDLRVDPEEGGKSFLPIPEKTDPPMVPILAALIGIVVIAVVLVVKFGGNEPPMPGTLENTVKARPPATVGAGQAAKTATEAPVGDLGFLNIESDKDAIIYVGDRKVGTTPLKRVEVTPGNHRVLAMDVETGARKSATTVVVRGQERRIVFQFR